MRQLHDRMGRCHLSDLTPATDRAGSYVDFDLKALAVRHVDAVERAGARVSSFDVILSIWNRSAARRARLELTELSALGTT